MLGVLFFQLLVRLCLISRNNLHVVELSSLTDLVKSVLAWTLPLFIFLVQLFHRQVSLELVSDALSSIDQSSRRNLSIRTHPFEIQNQSLIVLTDFPKS